MLTSPLGGVSFPTFGWIIGGAAAGAVIGATTGAAIASEAQRRRGGYSWWRGGCYRRCPERSWLQIAPSHCRFGDCGAGRP